jgi:aspartate ammonia-lyase
MGGRVEKDSLGEMEVPREAYYGIQTLRALGNFPVSGLKEHPVFVRGYVFIKKAAALTNMEQGALDEEKGRAIVAACDEVLSGRLMDQFVVDVFQAGAGTSFNMNVNEVLANRALELLGKPKGDYAALSPNDHVNMAQSTNDTFPTAIHVSSLMLLKELNPAIQGLIDALKEKGVEFAQVIKSGRTHLQDAVPVTLGQEFDAWAAALGRALSFMEDAERQLQELALGGTAVGTGLNIRPGYRKAVIIKLSELTGLPLVPAPDAREAMQSRIAAAGLSSSLKLLALELIRIANDLRLLSSGPTTGINEINLPPVQPGSSIMPGKVNPVMAECLNMVAFQVVGNDLTVSMAAQAGQYELNVMMPVMAHNILSSMEILKNFLPLFTRKCITGITANADRCGEYFENSPALATILNPYIGYLKAAEVSKEAVRRGVTIRQIILEKGLLDEKTLNRILDPSSITGGAEE